MKVFIKEQSIMVTLRRIGLRSAARVGFWFSVATNIFFLLIGAIIMIMNGVPVLQQPPEFWIRLVIMLTLNGLFSSLSTVIMAFLYNVIANAFGGIQLEFEMPDAVVNKRKNGTSRTVEVEIEDGTGE
jgi:hypothetical protein